RIAQRVDARAAAFGEAGATALDAGALLARPVRRAGVVAGAAVGGIIDGGYAAPTALLFAGTATVVAAVTAVVAVVVGPGVHRHHAPAERRPHIRPPPAERQQQAKHHPPGPRGHRLAVDIVHVCNKDTGRSGRQGPPKIPRPTSVALPGQGVKVMS